MAIIVEEPKNQSSLVAIVTWGIFFIVIATATYYLFFEQPRLIELSTPTNLENASSLAKLDLNPQDLVQNPSFQALVSTPIPSSTAPIGRANPFLSF